MPYRMGAHGTHGCSGFPVLVQSADGSWSTAPGGCHSSRADAVKHLAALKINVEESARTTVGDSMDRKTLPVDIEWKAASGSAGEVEGYASVFGNIDLDGDVVMPGAFSKSVQEFPKRTQPLPLIADHQLTTAGVVGSVVALKEDSKGLWFKAKFSSKSTAQDLRTDVIEGHVRGTSFTYDVIKAHPGFVNGKSVRQLHELRLWEITISPFPINQLAGLTAAKSGTAPRDEWMESMSHALAIVSERARKAAVAELVAQYPGVTDEQDDDTAAADQDADSTADDAADAGTSNPDDAYAVSFLHEGPSDETPDEKPSTGETLPEPLAILELERSQEAIDSAEAEILRALGRDE